MKLKLISFLPFLFLFVGAYSQAVRSLTTKDSAYIGTRIDSLKTGKVDKTTTISVNGTNPQALSGNVNLIVSGGNGGGGSIDTTKQSFDTLIVRRFTSVITPIDSAVWFGTSITAGQAAIPSTTNRFSYIASQMMGLVEKNKGVSGMTLIGSTGNAFLVNVRAGIIRSNYNSHVKDVFFEFGTNDFAQTDSISYDTTHFIAAYNEVLDSVIASGIPLNRVKILTPCYNTNVNSWRINNYLIAIVNLGKKRGVQVIDQYTPTADFASRFNFFTTDVIHPNTYGHLYMAFNIVNNIVGGLSIYNNGATVLNGVVQINNRLITKGGFMASSNTMYSKPANSVYDTMTATKANDVLDDIVINPYFRDSSFTNVSHIGLRIKNSNLAIGSGIKQTNTNYNDLLIDLGVGISSGNPGVGDYRLIPYTSAGNAEYRMYGGGAHRFYTTGGVAGNQLMALEIRATGDAYFSGLVNVGGRLWMPGAALSVKAGTQDILMNQNAGITATASGLTAANFTNRIIPQAGGGVMEFRTYRPQGKFDFYITNGVDSAQVLGMRLQENGGLLLGTSTYDASAKVNIASTTQGVLLPRMTKAQRDAIVLPAFGLIIYQTDNTQGIRVYNGTNWMKYTETTD